MSFCLHFKKITAAILKKGNLNVLGKLDFRELLFKIRA